MSELSRQSSRAYRTPAGTLCRIIETDEVIGDAGWRWGRKRAVRLAGRLNAMRSVPSHRYAVQARGWGRWRVIALQNIAEPVPRDG